MKKRARRCVTHITVQTCAEQHLRLQTTTFDFKHRKFLNMEIFRWKPLETAAAERALRFTAGPARTDVTRRSMLSDYLQIRATR